MPRSHAGIYAQILCDDFPAFISRAFSELNGGTKFLDNWHIDMMASKLEGVRAGECKRLIINVPPRHLKSFATSVAFIAWVLGHDPTKRILFMTYGQELSDSFALQIRTLMESRFYQSLFDTRLSSKALSELTTTKGGSILSTSIGGAVTGRGADLIVIDDPLKVGDALSDLRRRAVNEIYDNTVRSRLNRQEQGAIVIVMQRLHCDDLVAHVHTHEHWDVLSFSAIAERDETHRFWTPYGWRTVKRRQGDVLHPALLSLDKIEALRRSMTEYNFAAQYQQEPQPPSGLIVKREWVKFYSAAERPPRPLCTQVIQSWDTANKETQLSDYSVCTTWGLVGKRAYLLDVFRQKLDFPDLKLAVKMQAALHEATVVLIEDKASGTSLLQELRAEHFGIAQAAPSLDGDKIMRLHSQTAKISSGVALFPQDAVWLDIYLSELLAFPNAKNDDQVDSTVYALAWITQHPDPGILEYYRELSLEVSGRSSSISMGRYKPPQSISYYHAHDVQSGKSTSVHPEQDSTFLLTEEEGKCARMAGWAQI